MKVLGIIPARGGSKGVPRKNIRLLCGKPLLAYTAEAALQAKNLTRIILTTEDKEIAETGRNLGLEVPFLRPVHLAEDSTPTLPVIRHAIEFLENEGFFFDAICLLQPTNPLRRAEDIDNCLNLLAETNADSVVSVLPVPHEFNPKWVYWQDDAGRLKLSTGEAEPIPRRQDLPPAFHRDGSIYATKKGVIFKQNNLYGRDIRAYQMPPEYSANIDTLEDWNKIENRLREKINAASSNG